VGEFWILRRRAHNGEDEGIDEEMMAESIRARHFESPATTPLLTELEELSKRRRASLDPVEKQAMRDRAGELTQAFWRLFHHRNQGGEE